MANIGEIGVPSTKPATEWINGRARQKVNPQEGHARAQMRIAAVLAASGTLLVVLVDTERQTFTTFDVEGSKVLSRSDTFTHAALPGFAMPIASAFEKAPNSTRRR